MVKKRQKKNIKIKFKLEPKHVFLGYFLGFLGLHEICNISTSENNVQKYVKNEQNALMVIFSKPNSIMFVI